ncbi:MAG: insulinase family protein [Bacteroidales bacterium]|jgi:zinc protease|nr:insulinase family protein [Bacteroidales bacterium]
MKKTFITITAFLLSTLMAFGQGFNPQAPLKRDSSVVTGKLANGLTYYIKHNEKPAKRADFYIVTNSGAVNETPAQDGLAHFLEHMCFNGTDHFPGKGIISYMESIGAKFGKNINAQTGFEKTQYMLNNVPLIREGVIDTSLLILKDFSAYVTLDPKEVDDERGVILEEKRTTNTASYRNSMSLVHKLYNGTKLGDLTIIGSEDNLKNFKRDTLRNYYKKWYRPDNQAIIVVGDINPAEVEKKIKSIFGDLEDPQNPLVRPEIKPVDNEKPVVNIFTDPELTNTSVQLIVKSSPMPRQFRGMKISLMTDIFYSLFDEMANSRLSDIAQTPDAPFVMAQLAANENVLRYLDAFVLYVMPKEGKAIPAFERGLTEVKRMIKYGFTDDEFDRAKKSILSSLENAAANENSRKNRSIVPDYVNDFIDGVPFTSPSYDYEQAKACFAIFTPQIFNAMVSRMDLSKNAFISYSAPEKEGVSVPSEKELLKAFDSSLNAEVKPLKINAVSSSLMNSDSLKGCGIKSDSEYEFGTRKITLDNGIEVILKPTKFKEDQILFKTITTGGSSLLDDRCMPEVYRSIFPYLATSKGVAGFKMTDLSKVLSGRNVSCSPYVATTENGYSGRSSVKDFETALQLIYLQYSHPRSEESEVELAVNQMKQALKNYTKDPSVIFQNEFLKVLFENSSRKPLLNDEMLSKINAKDFLEAYSKMFSDPSGMKMIVIGNISDDSIRPLLQKYLGSLDVKSSGSRKYDKKNIVHFTNKGISNVFETPMKTPKTSVILYYSGKMKKDMKNSILMKAFSDIMTMNYTKTIREDEGGTYGVGVTGYIANIPSDEYLFMINFDMEPKNSDRLVKKTLDELKATAENGVDDDYFTKARENMLKQFPEDITTNGYWLGVLSDYLSYGYDRHSDYVKTVKEVLTKENLKKFAKKIVDKGHFGKILMNPSESGHGSTPEK